MASHLASRLDLSSQLLPSEWLYCHVLDLQVLLFFQPQWCLTFAAKLCFALMLTGSRPASVSGPSEASSCLAEACRERLLGDSGCLRSLGRDQHSLAGGHQLTVEEISCLLLQQRLASLAKRSHSVSHSQLAAVQAFRLRLCVISHKSQSDSRSPASLFSSHTVLRHL